MGEAEEHVIRETWRRFNAGDREFDPANMDRDLEIHSVLAGRVLRGADGLQAWYAEIDEQFESWQLEIAELNELEPGEYLGHGLIHVRGRNSALDLDVPVSWLVSFRDGRIWRLRNFMGPDSQAQAEAAGR